VVDIREQELRVSSVLKRGVGVEELHGTVLPLRRGQEVMS